MNTAVMMDKPAVYRLFCETYQHSGKLDDKRLAALYDGQVVFCDPVHRIEGLAALQAYFAGMVRRLNYCHFDFVDELVGSGQAYVTWDMHFSHPAIAGGQPQCLRGISHIRFSDGRIDYHEDCYDMGAMLYEHLPLLGRATRFLKNRLGNKR